MGQADREALDMDLASMGGRNPYLIGYQQERKKRGTQRTQNTGKKAGQIDMIWGMDIRATRGNTSKVTPYDRGGGSRGAGDRQRETHRTDLPKARAAAGERSVRPISRNSQPAGRSNRPSATDARRVERTARAGSRKIRPIDGNAYVQGRSARATVGTAQAAGRSCRTVVSPREAEKRRIQLQRRRAVLHKRIAIGIIEAVIVICLGIFVYIQVEKPQPATKLPAEVEAENEPKTVSGEKIQGISAEAYNKHPEWTEDFLTPNEYSRPGEPIGTVTNIFVHYTANPGTSAKQNRSYFEQLKDTHERGASAHFIIGYEGEIIQCVPLDEIAYAVQTRNYDSISIECCYKAENGSFTQETYDSLIGLLSWLTQTYGLDEQDILRHYDCGGKKCPIYYTENEDAWERLKKDVKGYEV